MLSAPKFSPPQRLQAHRTMPVMTLGYNTYMHLGICWNYHHEQPVSQDAQSQPPIPGETTERLHQAVFKQPKVAQTCTNYQAKMLPMVPLSLGSGKNMNLKTAFPQKKMMLYPRTITPPNIRPQKGQNPPPNPGVWTRPNSTPSSPQCSPTQHPNNSWVSESNVTLSQFGAVTDQKVPGQACG